MFCLSSELGVAECGSPTPSENRSGCEGISFGLPGSIRGGRVVQHASHGRAMGDGSRFKRVGNPVAVALVSEC